MSTRASVFYAQRSAAFTLVELLVGVTLSGMVMAAVLSSYIYLGRSFTRLANQQILESEARRTLANFTNDVQAATSISALSATSVTLILPSTTGLTTVAYTYSGSTLTRTPAGGTALILCRNIIGSGLTFRYYDSSGNEYTSYVNYLSGIRQLSVEFSTQTGVRGNATQTQIYRVASGRLLIHNSALLQ